MRPLQDRGDVLLQRYPVELVDIDAGFVASEVDLVIDLLTQKRSRLVSLTINSDRLKLSYLPPYSPPTSVWSCRSTNIGSKNTAFKAYAMPLLHRYEYRQHWHCQDLTRVAYLVASRF
jgi:hypothetical protein